MGWTENNFRILEMQDRTTNVHHGESHDKCHEDPSVHARKPWNNFRRFAVQLYGDLISTPPQRICDGLVCQSIELSGTAHRNPCRPLPLSLLESKPKIGWRQTTCMGQGGMEIAFLSMTSIPVTIHVRKDRFQAVTTVGVRTRFKWQGAWHSFVAAHVPMAVQEERSEEDRSPFGCLRIEQSRSSAVSIGADHWYLECRWRCCSDTWHGRVSVSVRVWW